MSYNSLRNNIFWNTAGNIIYLICQWLLSVVVVRISGNYTDAGVLTLVTSINKKKNIRPAVVYSFCVWEVVEIFYLMRTFLIR